MADRRVILSPGTKRETVYEGANAGYADGVLWIWTKETDLAAVIRRVGSPRYTGAIAFEYGINEETGDAMRDEFEGMTRFCYAGLDGDGFVSVALKQGEAD